MLRRSATTAATRVCRVHQRAFSVCGVRNSQVTTTSPQEFLPADMPQDAKDKCFPLLGNRDIVGRSFGSHYDYHDVADAPMPSIRWAANSSEVLALREKELADWTTLSLEEKKQLYRNSFRQTFAEFDRHSWQTGEWKRSLSFVLWSLALGTVLTVMNTLFYCVRPATMNKEYQQSTVAAVLMMNEDPMSGIASKYDYEKNEWKKK